MEQVMSWISRKHTRSIASESMKMSTLRKQTQILPTGRTIKVLVLGAAGVGKTSLVRRLSSQDVVKEQSEPTIYDVYQKEFKEDYGTVKLEVTDMTGEYRFPAMERLAIARTDVFVLVYALGDKKTLDELNRLRKSIVAIKKIDPTDIPLIVVGNKMDSVPNHTSNEVEFESEKEIEDWCFSHIFTSAQNGTNLFQFEETLVRECAACLIMSTMNSNRRNISGKLFYQDSPGQDSSKRRRIGSKSFKLFQ